LRGSRPPPSTKRQIKLIARDRFSVPTLPRIHF
jgi:hypothetical protein